MTSYDVNRTIRIVIICFPSARFVNRCHQIHYYAMNWMISSAMALPTTNLVVGVLKHNFLQSDVLRYGLLLLFSLDAKSHKFIYFAKCKRTQYIQSRNKTTDHSNIGSI